MRSRKESNQVGCRDWGGVGRCGFRGQLGKLNLKSRHLGQTSKWSEGVNPADSDRLIPVFQKRFQHWKSQANQASLREEHSRGGNGEQKKSEVSKLGVLEKEKGPGWLSGIRISEREADEVPREHTEVCTHTSHTGTDSWRLFFRFFFF